MSVFNEKSDVTAVTPLVDETTAKVLAALEGLGEKISGRIVDVVNVSVGRALAALPHVLEGYEIQVSPIVVKIVRSL